MSGLIRLLSDAVANQIAAGEVVQRPSSVVKELLENAIDAGATEILISIKNGGKTLIQISDNGSGIYPEDVRLAFERHATSKITKAEDLFSIQSFGFRGEALASIASVARVEMKTRPADMELGTKIIIEGSRFISQEQDQCPAGTHFYIKDLFFNIPARRNFLKSTQVEMKNIWDEIYRVSIPNYQIRFEVIVDDKPQIILEPTTLKQRIVNIFGKQYQQRLLNVEQETDFLKIQGFLVRPEYSRKQRGEQFFFVNNRFIKSPYLNSSIQNAYSGLIPQGDFAGYFVFLNIDPADIDVNIHPTKTEIKFKDERVVSAMLASVARRALGVNNAMPSIDFSIDANVGFTFDNCREIVQPEIKINPGFNPFKPSTTEAGERQNVESRKADLQQLIDHTWNTKMRESSLSQNDPYFETVLENDENKSHSNEGSSAQNSGLLWVKNRFIFTAVKSGTMIIDAVSAMERIIFDRYISKGSDGKVNSQQLLFPETIELPHSFAELMEEYADVISELGFTISRLGNLKWIVSGVPADFSTENLDLSNFLVSVLTDLNENRKMYSDIKNTAIMTLARKLSILQLPAISKDELQSLVDQLFASAQPQISPSGKRIFRIITVSELENLLK